MPRIKVSKFKEALNYIVTFKVNTGKLPTDRHMRGEGFSKYISEQARFLYNMNNAREAMQNSEVKSWLIFGDSHYPYHDEPTISAIMQFAMEYNPDGILHLGDMADFQSISSFNKGKPRLQNGLALIDDLDAFEAGLGVWSDFDCPKVFITGNHEQRLEWYIDEHQELDRIYSIDKMCQRNGWECIEYGGNYILGNIVCMHGKFYNKYHTNKMLELYGCNVLYGHTHDVQSHRKSVFGGNISAHSLGCTCSMNQHYMRNREKRWSNAFATLDIFPDKTTILTIVDVIDGKFTYNKKVYGEI